MSERPERPDAVSRRTNPLSFAVDAAQGLQNAVVPMALVFFSMRDEPWAIFGALGVGAFIAVISGAIAYVRWLRLTYVIGEADIRVESGLLSRAARSVPYERIQDVSLEQSLIPRLFGLVAVKFETGAGGKDDLSLKYLSEAEGERMREVVRARKDGTDEPGDAQSARSLPLAEPADTLFAMDRKRLVTFGLFEFSLAVFAVLAGAFQYADTFLGIQIWDPDLWSEWLAGPGNWIRELGPITQIISAIAGLATLLFVGSMTGLVSTVLRDWEFLLEKTAKGFRRRRGLLTRTDVVMPEHRVQAVNVGTRLIRRRFGWYGLKFVSLAQDSGSASHDVAPFAKIAEIEPIARAAGFAIAPTQDTPWLRGSRNYRIDSAVIELLAFCAVATGIGIVLFASDKVSPLWALAIVGVGALFALRQMFLWRFDYNAIDPAYLFVRRGWLAPKLEVGSRIKLQSVEIARGPIAGRRGYATLKLGLAGGKLEIEGLPIERAHELRRAILTSIAGTDFSELT